MTSYKSIQAAVVKRLKKHGYDVTPNEAEEGFPLSAFFIDVFPSSTEVLTSSYVLKTVTVEIRYIPKEETHEARLEMADILQDILTEAPLEFDTRYADVFGMDFIADASALLCTFAMEFADDIRKPKEPKEPPMEQLILNEEVS